MTDQSKPKSPFIITDATAPMEIPVIQPSTWKQSSPETLDKIEYLYQILVSITESPMESTEIMSGVYVRLWITGKADNADIDSMLEGLCLCIKTNVESIESSVQ